LCSAAPGGRESVSPQRTRAAICLDECLESHDATIVWAANIRGCSRTVIVDHMHAKRAMSQGSTAPECGPSLRALFTRTYQEERKFIRSVVRRLGVPPGDVEDAVQDVFVVLHRRLHELDADTALRFWLGSVAFRVCGNHRRKTSLQSHVGVLEPDTLHDLSQRRPDEACALSEIRRALMRAFEQLDDKKQEVLVLAELEERSAREIAQLTQTLPNTVSSRLRAARQHVAHAVRAGRRDF
jgi:RNA polymerase sigma-70 factor, ECF subfamily